MISIPKPSFVAVFANALAAPIAVGLAFVLESAAIDYANSGHWVDLSGWVLNLLPSALAGIVVYAITSVILNRVFGPSLTISWFVRDIVPLVLAAIFSVLIILSAPNNPDFWLFGQLLMWPLAALVAGLCCDLAITSFFRQGWGRAAA